MATKFCPEEKILEIVKTWHPRINREENAKYRITFDLEAPRYGTYIHTGEISYNIGYQIIAYSNVPEVLDAAESRKREIIKHQPLEILDLHYDRLIPVLVQIGYKNIPIETISHDHDEIWFIFYMTGRTTIDSTEKHVCSNLRGNELVNHDDISMVACGSVILFDAEEASLLAISLSHGYVIYKSGDVILSHYKQVMERLKCNKIIVVYKL
jgi:hypothetical protein